MSQFYKRVFIVNVKPLADYILQVDFISGSRVLLDMKDYLDGVRFRTLKRPEIWNTADTDGILVRFGAVEISHDEIIEMIAAPAQGKYGAAEGRE